MDRRNRLSVFEHVRFVDLQSEFKTYFRIYLYSVISTTSSVIYFGGLTSEDDPNDLVAEFKDLEWNKLGNLAGPRHGHRSIKMGNKVYLFGGQNIT